MPTIEEAISVEGLSLTLDGHVILRNVSLRVGRPEVVALQGHNGVGKSSLLATLASLLEGRGRVTLVGRRPGTPSIGFVWQQSYQALMPWLSALDNASFPLLLRREPRRDRERAIHSLAEQIGWILPDLTKRPYELSGGEQQKLNVLRAIVADPDIILADEPVAAMDERSRLQAMTSLRDLAYERNASLLVVSHDLELNTFIADRVLTLRGEPAALDAGDFVRIEREGSRPLDWLREADFDRALAEVRRALTHVAA